MRLLEVKEGKRLTEYFWVVDEDDRVVGKASREDCHKNKELIHRSVYVFLVNSENEMFLQKRAESKDLYPGYYTGSATGHVDYGETYREAAVRELEEELGVKVPLKKVCKFKCFSEIEREISVLYVCSFEGDVTFSDKEISRGVFMSIESVKKEVEFGEKKFALGFKKALREFCESTESKQV